MEIRPAALKIPYGTRDFLPREAAAKRRTESAIAECFARWGYSEVVVPTLEYLDTLSMGSGSSLAPHMFKFFDRDNRTLALRHELTTPIARLTASRLKDEALPLRLSYIGEVFRYEQAQAGRQCEFFQAGVELMGSSSPGADAEVVALAAASLLAAGLDDFTICLGEVNFIKACLAEIGLDGDGRRQAAELLETHNLVGLAELSERLHLNAAAQKILMSLPILHGGEETLQAARDLTNSSEAVAAIDNLAQIAARLENYGIRERIVFDLGVIRDFGYYTGMVFEAYAPSLGFPVLGGGRYDNLLSDFGSCCPATGFALGIDRLLLARERQGENLPDVKFDVYVSYATNDAAATQKADLLRCEGKTVILALQGESRDEAKKSQAARNANELIYID